VKGIHSEYLYKSIETSADGIIDFKLDDSGDEPRNLMRIRAMRNVGFDGRWHQLKTDDRFEVTLE
jgi:KaiC/GvpD/RAD55 family RecA-like ATPase